MTHVLKCWPTYFQAVLDGSKRFEVRPNDRDFRVHDTLRLREYELDADRYTGRECDRGVTYLLRGGQFGIEPGYVILGLAPALQQKEAA